MILAAGQGIRLRPLTLTLPKVLLPVGGVPVIEHILLWLKRHGIAEVAVNLYHLGAKIIDLLGDGSRFGVKITYSSEETLLGTAGGVKKMEHFFDGTFVVVCGDVVTDFDLSAMLQFHREKRAMATLALVEVSNPWEVGIAEINESGKLISFVEKPPRGVEPGNLGNGGIYVLEKEILNHIASEGFCDFAYEILPKIIKLGLSVYGYRLNRDDYLFDTGTPEKYDQANKYFTLRKVKTEYGNQSRLP